jgi:hypothetical protein
MNRKFFLGLSIAAVSAVIFLTMREQKREPANLEAERENILSQSRCDLGTPFQFKQQNGQSVVYDYSRTVQATGFPNNQSLDLQYEGQFFLTPIAAKTGTTQVIFSADISSVTVAGRKLTGKAIQGGELAQVASRNPKSALMAELLPNGKIKALYMHKQALPGAMNIMRDLVASYVQEIPTGTTAQFRGPGQDTTGVYEADYVFKPCGFDKRKLRYTQVKNLALKDLPTIEDSKHSWTMSDFGYPRSAEGFDRLTLSAAVAIKTSVRYGFEFSDVIPKGLWTGKDLALFTVRTALNLESEGMLMTGSSGKQPGFVVLDWKKDLIPALNKIDKNMRDGARLELFHDLNRLLKSRPELLPEFMAEAIKSNFESDKYRLLIGAINTLGTPEAQKVLTDIYKNPGVDKNGKQTVLSAFVLAESQPTTDSKAFLSQVVTSPTTDKNLRESALLAVGSSQKRSPDPQQRSLLQSQYQNAAERSDQMVAMQAIGNSGDTALKTVIAETLKDETKHSPSLRQEAVYSLRFMVDQDSRNFLKTALQGQNLDAKHAASEALYFQENLGEFQDTLLNCLAKENKAIRTNCARVVFRDLKALPKAEGELRRLAKDSATDASFREYIEGQFNSRLKK